MTKHDVDIEDLKRRVGSLSLDLSMSIKRPVGFDGKAIRLGEKVFDHGASVCPKVGVVSRLSYELDANDTPCWRVTARCDGGMFDVPSNRIAHMPETMRDAIECMLLDFMHDVANGDDDAETCAERCAKRYSDVLRMVAK